MSAFLLGTNKSIPIQSLPPEAWRMITGEGVQNEDSTARRYADVAYLYRGIQVRCSSLSGLPYAWHKGGVDGDELEDEPQFPFELNLRALLWQLELHIILFGRGYVMRERNRFGVVKELCALYPLTVTPEIDAEKGLTGFKRSIGSRQVDLKPEDVVYIWTPPHDKEVGYGVGEAEVALRAAGVLANIDEFARRFFMQGAVNPTIVSIPAGTPPADQERLQSWYKRMLTGVKNAFNVTAISGETKFSQLGFPPNQLATPELTAAKRQDIATALGIPQSLLDSNAANYATARQDDLHFYGKTVLPRAMLIAEALNTQLFEALGYTLVFHPERLESYQAQESEKAQGLVTLVQAGILTVNEARERMELPPLEDDENEPEEANEDTDKPDMQESEQSTPEMEDDTDEMQEEVKRWQRVVRKRYAEGRPEKARAFKSDVIPPPIHAAIVAQLEDATDAHEAETIVSSAVNWSGYP